MRSLQINTDGFDAYVRDGCGRCEHFRTPACKVHRWTAELTLLRDLVLSAGLVETMKWGSPCYTVDGKNVVMLASFKEHCALSFFQGAALGDDDGLLRSPGPNSRFVRAVYFESAAQVVAREPTLRRLLQQAIDRERAGQKVDAVPAAEPIPAELHQLLDGDGALGAAFAALTPGRRRSHILHVRGAKQAATRVRRAEQCAVDIAAGRGFRER
jgi:uncharacterized protein YdeI (YjbR/CyaY-like superfamily)